MQALGLFSGFGGFELAMSRAGIDLVGMCEINPRCRQVLSKQFEGVPIYEDVKHVSTQALGYDYGDINLITGGFPCQNISRAGGREGLAGERSGLWFQHLRIIRETRAQWVVIENVADLLSSNKGEDFATILEGLVRCGYRVAWRVFDAQFFGLAQQRRRVFIVGHLRDGRAAEILFEPAGIEGNFATGETVEHEVAYCLTTGVGTYRGNGYDNLILAEPKAKTLTASGKRFSPRTDTLIPLYYTDTHQQDRISSPLGKSPALLHNLSGGAWKIFQGARVRRLTPAECARLQGFSDDWCDGLSDTAKYEALGNAIAVPVLHWILKRIVEAN